MKAASIRRFSLGMYVAAILAALAYACAPSGKSNSSGGLLAGDAATRTYVPPGSYDEYYAFLSGGFSGQVTVYGLPSGRLLKLIPVFSQFPQTGYGYDEETKPMLKTTFGFVPWDDSHHTELSLTNGVPDGRWLFINGNNTPRIARIDLTKFETDEILQIPNAAGGHASPFTTPDTKYVVSATRFSVPDPADTTSRSTATSRTSRARCPSSRADQPGKMDVAFQIMMPGYDYDLGHAGKGPSDGWFFFTSYNSEQANTKLEVNASQNDKDYIAAVNYKRAEQCIAQGKAKEVRRRVTCTTTSTRATRIATSETKTGVKMLYPADCDGLVYYLPTPKSPHGVDVDPTGEYIVAGGKLATVIPVHSFTKMMKAIADKQFEKTIDGIPVLKYDAVIAGEVQKPGPRPAAHRVRRQGQRLHVDVHLVRSREVEARHVGGARSHPGLLLGRPPHDSRVATARSRGASTSSRSTRSPRTATCRPARRIALGAADRHQRRQDEDAARLPDDRRAALRAGGSGEPDQAEISSSSTS